MHSGIKEKKSGVASVGQEEKCGVRNEISAIWSAAHRCPMKIENSSEATMIKLVHLNNTTISLVYQIEKENLL